MVRCDACQRAPMHVQTNRVQGGIHENVIDGERGEGSWESAKCPHRRDQLAHVAEVLRQRPVGAGAGQAVEIAQQNKGSLGRVCAKPFIVEQLSLEQALTSPQAEMGIDQVDNSRGVSTSIEIATRVSRQ